jgi:hypothetical protein
MAIPVAEIWAEMARRKVQFHPNEAWDQIALWGLFPYGAITPLCKRGLLDRGDARPENRTVWCRPSKEAWENHIRPLIEKHSLAELTVMAGWPAPAESREFPHLSDALQDLAREAKEYDLAMSHYNSGTRNHPDNGTRLFFSRGGEYRDHFSGGHLVHCRTIGEVQTFLAGYKAGISRGGYELSQAMIYERGEIDGLRKWADDYRKARGFGNVTLAKQIRDNIAARLAALPGLDSKRAEIFGKDDPLADSGYRVNPHPGGNGWSIVADAAGACLSEHASARTAAARVRRLNRQLLSD